MRGLLTVPNVLTLIRLLVTPLVARAILRPAPLEALALLFAVGSTDALDGYLARRFRWTSASGAYLDPVADKVLAAVTYVSLGFAGLLPWWLIALVFGRDALILAAAGVLLAGGKRREFPPSVWGKISTFFQISAALGALAGAAFPALPLAPLVSALIVLAAAGTVWSGAHYFYTGLLKSLAPPSTP